MAYSVDSDSGDDSESDLSTVDDDQTSEQLPPGCSKNIAAAAPGLSVDAIFKPEAVTDSVPNPRPSLQSSLAATEDDTVRKVDASALVPSSSSCLTAGGPVNICVSLAPPTSVDALLLPNGSGRISVRCDLSQDRGAALEALGTKTVSFALPQSAAKIRTEQNRQIALQRQRERLAKEASRGREAGRELGQVSLDQYGVKRGPIRSHRVPIRTYSPPAMLGGTSTPRTPQGCTLPLSSDSPTVTDGPNDYSPILGAPKSKERNPLRKKRLFSGSAGTGKSFLLEEIVRMLGSMGRHVSVTAPTGIAALNIGGATIHSWAKVGLGHGSVHELYNQMYKAQTNIALSRNKPADDLQIRNECDVLIIDEISMLHPELFDRLSIACKALRHNSLPFGGIHLIISGDFFQLPPILQDEDITCPFCGCSGIERDASKRTLRCVLPINKSFRGTICGKSRFEPKYCFETVTWRELRLSVMELTQVFRQDDKLFIDTLNKIRRGIVDEQVDWLLRDHARPLPLHRIKPTTLCAVRTYVNGVNIRQFDLLPDAPLTFKAKDAYNGPYAHTHKERLSDIPALREVKLKIGAQVMLLVNLDAQAGFVNGSRGVVIGWEPAVQTKDQAERPQNTMFPRVYFMNNEIRTVKSHVWSIPIDNENSLSRTQIPLSLSWALTIHKSQGQSLDRLQVDLSGVFANGQAYVALSRARNLEGLQVIGWRKDAVKTDPLVVQFYRSLGSTGAEDSPNDDVLRVEDYFPEEIVRSLTDKTYTQASATSKAPQRISEMSSTKTLHGLSVDVKGTVDPLGTYEKSLKAHLLDLRTGLGKVEGGSWSVLDISKRTAEAIRGVFGEDGEPACSPGPKEGKKKRRLKEVKTEEAPDAKEMVALEQDVDSLEVEEAKAMRKKAKREKKAEKRRRKAANLTASLTTIGADLGAAPTPAVALCEHQVPTLPIKESPSNGGKKKRQKGPNANGDMEGPKKKKRKGRKVKEETPSPDAVKCESLDPVTPQFSSPSPSMASKVKKTSHTKVSSHRKLKKVKRENGM